MDGDSLSQSDLVRNTCSFLKDIGNILRLLNYFVSAACCSEDRKPNCLFHPWREINLECQSKIIGASNPVTRLIPGVNYESCCQLFLFLALSRCDKLSIKGKPPPKCITQISSSSTLAKDSRERYCRVVEHLFLFTECSNAAEYLARKYKL